MKNVKYFMGMVLLLSLMLTMCACTRTAQPKDIETVDIGDTRMIIVTLLGSDIALSEVKVFPVEKNGSVSSDASPLLPAFDGVDTYVLTLAQGGNYILEVTNAQKQTAQYYLSMTKDTLVYSFHISLTPKPESQVRPLWPQTPHNMPEPY